MDDGLLSIVKSLHALQKRQISKERQKVTDDLRLQPGRPEDFRKFSVNVIVGFFELVQKRTDQLSIPRARIAKVNDV